MDLGDGGSLKKDIDLAVGGETQKATCCCWLPTDNKLFAAGYGDLLAVINYQTGQVENVENVASSPIVSIVAHQFQH